MTGRTVSAAEAGDWGLVARVVPHDELLPTAVDALDVVLPHRARGPARR